MRSAAARRDAYLAAMAQLGLPVSPENLVEGTHTMEGGIKACGALLHCRRYLPALSAPTI